MHMDPTSGRRITSLGISTKRPNTFCGCACVSWCVQRAGKGNNKKDCQQINRSFWNKINDLFLCKNEQSSVFLVSRDEIELELKLVSVCCQFHRYDILVS